VESLRSALLIEIPEAEPTVRDHRLRFDRVAELGVPTHITALFPFVEPSDLDEEATDLVAEVAGRHAPFDHRFSTTGWFDDAVLYLPPDDPAPFVRLIQGLADAFPAHPRYGGAFPETVPHLTVAREADLADLRAVERSLLNALPVAGRAQQLTLMVESADGRWTRARTFPLQGA
jgi:2'-5' RNA ligase